VYYLRHLTTTPKRRLQGTIPYLMFQHSCTAFVPVNISVKTMRTRSRHPHYYHDRTILLENHLGDPNTVVFRSICLASFREVCTIILGTRNVLKTIATSSKNPRKSPTLGRTF
jgi:hypothetical protein